MDTTPTPPDIPERVHVLETLFERMDRRLDRLDQRLVSLTEEMRGTKANVATLASRMEQMNTEMTRRIEQMNTELTRRIEQVNASLTARIEQVNASLTGQIERVNASLMTRIEQVNANLTGRIEHLSGQIRNLPTTWQMITYTLAAQITLATLLFGAYRLGH
jgi:chromosome segregation ATPase